MSATVQPYLNGNDPRRRTHVTAQGPLELATGLPSPRHTIGV
ncbi:MAG TPA: hypothetical protein VN712_08765 [Dermatophilaceae bacterium]|nr:hypothetical protein [Dermatophilaceae bacterium]